MDKKIVLVVDDEQDLTFLVSEIIKEEGHDVYVANDGSQAIEKIESINPDIIFLDFVMPNVRGDKVLEFIKTKSSNKRASVILMSGLGEMVYFKEKDQWKWLPNSAVVQNSKAGLPDVLKWKKSPQDIAEGFGVKAFLSKPFSKDALLEVFQEVAGENNT